jgi:hypothetical protein
MAAASNQPDSEATGRPTTHAGSNPTNALPWIGAPPSRSAARMGRSITRRRLPHTSRPRPCASCSAARRRAPAAAAPSGRHDPGESLAAGGQDGLNGYRGVVIADGYGAYKALPARL